MSVRIADDRLSVHHCRLQHSGTVYRWISTRPTERADGIPWCTINCPCVHNSRPNRCNQAPTASCRIQQLMRGDVRSLARYAVRRLATSCLDCRTAGKFEWFLYSTGHRDLHCMQCFKTCFAVFLWADELMIIIIIWKFVIDQFSGSGTALGLVCVCVCVWVCVRTITLNWTTFDPGILHRRSSWHHLEQG